MTRLSAIFALILSLLLPSLAWAGSEPAAGAPVRSQQTIAAFTDELQRKLAEKGAHVAIVGRSGRSPDSLPDGIRYTHVAYWVYSEMTRADGSTYTGYRVYNLYQQGEDGRSSALIQDSPEEFFAASFELDAGIIIPDIRLQKKLLKTIASPTYEYLHNDSYAVLANPMTTTFQNCTEHTLDVLMASLYGTKDKARIKANINAYFDPQPVEVSGMKRLLAPAAAPALTTADHGSQVATATFGSIARFMRENNLDAHIYRHTAVGPVGYPI